jgi:hypothetical protein
VFGFEERGIYAASPTDAICALKRAKARAPKANQDIAPIFRNLGMGGVRVVVQKRGRRWGCALKKKSTGNKTNRKFTCPVKASERRRKTPSRVARSNSFGILAFIV